MKYILQGWNAFERVGILSTELEYLCTVLECFLHGWNDLYSAVDFWNAFDSGGIPLYRVGKLSGGLE
jgi:hypothetical protein